MRYIISFIFQLSLVVCSAAVAQTSLKPSDKTIAFLKIFRSDYNKCLLTKESEVIQGYLNADIRLMPEFQKTMIGKSNVMAYLHAFNARFDVSEFARSEIEILDLGTRVMELGTFRQKIKIKNASKEHELRGKYLDVWEKLANGTLTLVTEAWNYSHGFEIEDQMRFTEIPAVNVAFQAHVPINNHVSFELAALNGLMETTISQHDPKIWIQFYTWDGMVCYSRHPIYQGKEAMVDFLEKHCKELPIFEKLDIRNDRIDNLGNYVIEYASHTAIIRAGDYSGVGTGKDLRIWRREPDGALKIFRHIGMYD